MQDDIPAFPVVHPHLIRALKARYPAEDPVPQPGMDLYLYWYKCGQQQVLRFLQEELERQQAPPDVQPA